MLSLNLSPLHKPSLTPHSLSSKTPLLPTLFSLRRHRRHRRRVRGLQIQAIDAVQPYDYEARLAVDFRSTTKLKIAVIGFGNFGQFLAETFVDQGHKVLAHSRSDYSQIAKAIGVSFFANVDDLCEQHPEVILLCTSVLSTEAVLKSLPFKRLKRSTLIADVLSVKEFPKNLMLKLLPSYFDIVCTHPMFGPQSGKNGWSGLNFVYDKVRVGTDEARVSRCDRFLNIFKKEGCKMVEMSCTDHDNFAAESQFITHTVGRVLESLRLESTPINTKGYETLLDLVDNTAADSFDLYYGLFMYNDKSLEVFNRFDFAFEALKDLLNGRNYDVARKQVFGWHESPPREKPRERTADPQNGAAPPPVSSAVATTRSQNFIIPIGNQAQIFKRLENNSKLKIALIGFGNFGQFLAKTFVRQGHTVLAYSRSDYLDVAQKLGVSYFFDIDDLCEEHPEVIIICTSILSTRKVLESVPVQRLKRSTLFVDVLSVKEFPKNLFIQNLPSDFDILCTHPMFGPESGKNGWDSLTFVYDRVRIGNEEPRVLRCKRFLDIFAREGCQMVEMTCEEHDKYAAGSQFITHTMGRILERLVLKPTPINTKGYETLLKLVENTAGDSFDLYYGLFLFNGNSIGELRKLYHAAKNLRNQLSEISHGIHRKQLFGDDEDSPVTEAKPRLLLSENRSVPESSFNRSFKSN